MQTESVNIAETRSDPPLPRKAYKQRRVVVSRVCINDLVVMGNFDTAYILGDPDSDVFERENRSDPIQHLFGRKSV